MQAYAKALPLLGPTARIARQSLAMLELSHCKDKATPCLCSGPAYTRARRSLAPSQASTGKARQGFALLLLGFDTLAQGTSKQQQDEQARAVCVQARQAKEPLPEPSEARRGVGD